MLSAAFLAAISVSFGLLLIQIQYGPWMSDTDNVTGPIRWIRNATAVIALLLWVLVVVVAAIVAVF
jgi:hypothetical protein